MEYRHNPPTLAELRRMRREMQAARENEVPEKKKKGFFSSIFAAEEKEDNKVEDAQAAEKLASYEHDIILAHLENQNELLLELARRIDRATNAK